MKARFETGQGTPDLQRFERPEDDLDTADSTYVKQRERKFNAEHGFENLLQLKVVLEDLTVSGREDDGILRESLHPKFITDVIEEPQRYAYSNLGFSQVLGKELDPGLLQQRLKEFLEKEKVVYERLISHSLEDITLYKGRTGSIALDRVEQQLKYFKELVLNGKWEKFCQDLTELKEYIKGMTGILELTLGRQRENDNVRKVLKAPPRRGEKK